LGEDLIVAFVTSNVEPVNDRSEHLLDRSHPEFTATGLKVPSVIRLGKLATLERRLVQRRLGRVGVATRQAIARCLRYVFDL